MIIYIYIYMLICLGRSSVSHFFSPTFQVDMQMQGPTTGACSGAAFHNDGNDITIADANESLGGTTRTTWGMDRKQSLNGLMVYIMDM